MKTIILTFGITLALLTYSCDEKDDTNLIDDDAIENEYEELISSFGNDTTDFWGIGFLSNNKYNGGEMTNFPDSFINVYNKANGEAIGKLYRIENQYYGALFEDYNAHTVNKVNKKDFVEVTYEGQNLKFYANEDEFYQCLIHSIDSGVWIKRGDLEKAGFSLIDWESFLISSNYLYHSIDTNGILLYDTSLQVIDTLQNNVNEIKLIDEKFRGMLKVEVYNVGACVGGDGEKTGVAWIKEIINEEGHPIIFFYSRGC